MRSRTPEEVVVLGGGYAGTIAALRAAGRGRRRVRVTLVDPKAEFVQRLRLHQVATGQDVAQLAFSKLLGRKVEFIQGVAETIDTDEGVLHLARSDRGRLPFDRLIYAVGSTTDVSRIPGVAEFAHHIGDAAAARGLDHALHHASDGAAVAVVGAGMTGLEMVSEIATALPRLHTTLVTHGTVGGWLSQRGREHVQAVLSRQGVELVERATVGRVEANRILLLDGAEIPARIVVWCGGFCAPALAEQSGLATDELGRVLVDRSMRSLSHPQISAAGDSAVTPAFVAGAPLRMCCQVAIPTGAYAADAVIAQVRGHEPGEVHFGYLHQPISLGRHDGLIQFVDRGDRPKDSILTGRRAAAYKEFVTAGGLASIKLERRIPGTTKWPFKEPKAHPQLNAGAAAAKL